MPELGRAIREARRRKGWTERDLAQRAGVGTGPIHRLETSRTTLRLADSSEPIARVFALLGLSGDLILRILGFREEEL